MKQTRDAYKSMCMCHTSVHREKGKRGRIVEGSPMKGRGRITEEVPSC